MKIAIFYHSVTGNTEFAAKMIKKGINESGNECDLFYIHHLEFNDYEKYDLLGFGTPVFAFREMTPVKNFIQNLPKMDKYAFIFCTCNSNKGNTLYRMASYLKRKGIKVFKGKVFYFPSSYTVWRKKGQKDVIKKSEVNKMVNFGLNLVSIYEKAKIERKLPTFYYSILNGILGRFSSDTNLRIYLGKIYVNTELCNKCGDCEKICPADAIKLDPYPKISKKCTGCCGCINLCPNGALYTSKTKNRPTYKFDESLLEK